MIKKAMVLAAGKGTRLLPLTLAIPKEMIRIGAKPIIEHVIEVLRAGEIRDILVIVGRKKSAIMDYLGSGERFGLRIYYRVQEEPKGTAHAVYCGKDFLDSQDFIVMYGDNYLKPYHIMRDVIEFHETNEADVTLVLHPVKDPRRFGVVKIDKKAKVLGMMEKPSLEEAKPYRKNDHYLNIAGLSILNNKIFEYIERTKPGKNNELWLTDAIEMMRRDGYKILGYIFEGTRYNVGTYESLKKADEVEQREEK